MPMAPPEWRRKTVAKKPQPNLTKPHFSPSKPQGLCNKAPPAQCRRNQAPRAASSGNRVMIQEFKEFLSKGNVMDLAVGIIIGAAFTAIVGSLVSDLINPLIGLILGGVDFSGLYVVLKGTVPDGASLAAAREAGAAVFAYGAFITAIINFLIIGWVVFMLVKAMNNMMPKKAPPPAGPSELDVLKDILVAVKR
jgi:large conductance mechanosensitive channel